MLGPTEHHVDKRITCEDCGTRVFRFAIDDSDNLVRYYCKTCADRKRRIILCRACQVPIAKVNGYWQHSIPKLGTKSGVHNHAAVPEPLSWTTPTPDSTAAAAGE